MTRPWLRRVLVAAAFLAGVYASMLQSPATRPLTFDNQVTFYMTVRAADGVPPHVSVVDHKHHVPVLVSAAAMKIGRLFGVDDVFSARAASIFVAAVATASVAWLAVELGGIEAGLIATLAFLVSPGFFSQAAMGFRPQLFVAALTLLSLVAFAKERMIAAGLAGASAFLCWQPAALIGAALAAAALVGRDWMRTWARLLSGAAIAIGLYELYFALHGALGEQLSQSYAMAAEFKEYSYPAITDSLRFFLAYGVGWRSDSSWLLPAGFLVLLALGPLYFLVHARARLAAWRERPVRLAMVLIAYLTTAVTFLTHEGYPDMFFVEPLMAIVVGLAFTWLGSHAAKLLGFAAAPWIPRYAVIGAAALWLAMLHVSRTDVFANTGLHLLDQRRLASQVDLLYDDFGSVWAVGCPHLLAFKRRENFLPYALLIDEKVQEYMTRDTRPGAAYLPLRNGRLPGAILSSRGGLRTVIPWLLHEYRRIENRSFKLHGIQVWLRRLPKPGEARSPGSIRGTQK